MIELFYSYASILPLVGAVSAVIFIISLLSLLWLAAKIPQDYFLYSQRQPPLWQAKTRPIFRLLLIVVKNLLGCILLAGGFLMLFIPGQGVLTMVMGLILIDYPGKYSVEKAIIGYPAVFKGLNWLRARAHKPPLRKHDS